MYKSIKDDIATSIARGGRGRFIFLQDMEKVADYESVKKAFQRLTNEKMLIRIEKGIYWYPKIDTELGLGVLYPSIDMVAMAIAKRDKLRVAPTVAFAQNALGLSTQLESNVVFYTDGPERRVKVGKGKGILFLHTSDMSRFAYKSRLMQLIVTALVDYGEKGVRDSDLETIKPFLAHVAPKQFAHDIKLAPIWLQEKLKKYDIRKSEQ